MTTPDPPPKRVAALRARADDLTERATDVLDEARERFPPVDMAVKAVERDAEISGFVMAGALAFRLFVYLLPVYLLVLVIAGAAVSFDPQSPEELASSAGMSSYLAATIADASATSKRSLWILIPLTLYAILSTGKAAQKLLVHAHTQAWGLPDRRKATYAESAGFFGFSLVLLLGMAAVRGMREGLLTPLSFVLGGCFYFGLWLVASRLLPRAEGTTWWSLVPGAALVAAGAQGLYLFNVLYLTRKIHSASQAYGALGIAASALLVFYLIGRLTIAAPVLNATLWERWRTDPPTDG